MGKLSVAELRKLAAGYRRAAKTARIIKIRDALTKIANRYEALADKREQEQLRRKSADHSD